MLDKIIGRAFVEAKFKRVNIPKDAAGIDGMTGSKIKHFLAYAVRRIAGRHLAIGVFKGATLCCALAGSTANAHSVAIDSWSIHGGSEQALLGHTRKNCIHDLLLINKDCWSVTKEDLKVEEYGKFSSYMYDAGHTLEDQIKAITYYSEYLTDPFVYFCDDFNAKDRVEEGTRRGIKEAGLKIIHEWTKYRDRPHIPDQRDIGGWWNGFFCAIVGRK